MRTSKLNKALRKTGRLTLLTEAFCAFCAALVVLLVAMLLAVAIDVAMSLDVWELIFIDIVLGALALGALAYIARIAYGNRYRPRRLARFVENRMHIGDNSLINAVDLAAHPPDATSSELREVVVLRGEALAATISPARLVETKRLRSAMLSAGIAVLVTAAALVVLPGVFRAVIPRFLHPAADYPPFTLVEFHVRIEPEKVYHSRPATITATIRSAASVPGQANVVFSDPRRSMQQSLPMLRSPGGQFVLRIQRAERSRYFYIDTPAGRSKRYLLKVHPVPRFERVNVKYEFPAYTRWPDGRSVLEGDKGLRAIKGTRVTLAVTSNLPLGAGKMVLVGSAKDAKPTEVKLTPTEDPLVVRGGFDLNFSGRYSLTLRSADGVAGNESFDGAITCVPDSDPRVEFLEPAQTVVAPANWKINVVVAARDDVEVARIILLRSINGWAPTEAALKLEAPGPTYATAKYLFDLSVLGARAGDVITYYASAYDVYPGSAHFSDTPTFVIRVISEEEYLQYARSAYRTEELIAELEDFLRRIEELDALRKELLKQAEELERKIRDSGGKLSDADMEELRQFARDQDEYADRMRELADRMLERVDKPTLYEFEASFKDMLKRMAQDLRGQASEMSALTLSFDQLQKRGLRRLPSREYLQDSIAQLRGAEEFMDNFHEEALLTDRQLQQLQKADELVALTEVIVAITEQQRELADRLGQFRNKERLGPAEQIRARRMAQEQAELRAQLQAALEEMDTKATEAQDILPKMSASLRKIVADIRRLNVLRDQDNAATLAHAGRGRYAWPAADDAAAKLESLFEECGGTQGMMARAAEDLDRALKLTKQKISLGLQQLSQSRGMPGTGQSGSGGAGGGYYGSRAQLTLMGPHASGGGDSDARRGRGRRGRGRGAWRPAGRKEPEDAESITPEADVDRSRDVRGTLGVPVRYRGLAEEYFRRLADESK